MVKAGKGPVARRVAISVIALFALLLQGLLAAPAAAVDAHGGVICAQSKSGPQTPDGDQHRHHGLCCILACAASGSIFAASAAGVVFFAPRASSRLEFASASVASTRAAAQFYLPPRGPPQAL
jgi:hypothetical protein